MEAAALANRSPLHQTPTRAYRQTAQERRFNLHADHVVGIVHAGLGRAGPPWYHNGQHDARFERVCDARTDASLPFLNSTTQCDVRAAGFPRAAGRLGATPAKSRCALPIGNADTEIARWRSIPNVAWWPRGMP